MLTGLLPRVLNPAGVCIFSYGKQWISLAGRPGFFLSIGFVQGSSHWCWFWRHLSCLRTDQMVPAVTLFACFVTFSTFQQVISSRIIHSLSYFSLCLLQKLELGNMSCIFFFFLCCGIKVLQLFSSYFFSLSSCHSLRELVVYERPGISGITRGGGDLKSENSQLVYICTYSVSVSQNIHCLKV